VEREEEEALSSEIGVKVDLAFRLTGNVVPQDHGHAMFGALGKVLGDVHGAEWLAVHPLVGTPRGDGMLAVNGRHGLRLRVAPGEIPRLLPLAGKRLEIQGCPLLVGVSSVFALQSARTLWTRMVTIKGFMEPEPFRDAVKRQLDAMAVKARVEVGQRRVMHVNGKTVVGFGVTLHELDEEGSLKVQFAGLGGKQRMGCGVMSPVRRS
jgi:CRISPR-associated protein Cas6